MRVRMTNDRGRTENVIREYIDTIPLVYRILILRGQHIVHTIRIV